MSFVRWYSRVVGPQWPLHLCVALVCLATLSTACADDITQPSRPIPGARGDLVPTTPPDGIPDWVTADSSLSPDGINTKGVIVVTFTTGSSQADMLCSPFRETDSGAHSALFRPVGVRRLTVL